jgi:hypothetical protein
MVALARAIYNPRPGELTGELRDPGELCEPDLADRAAVESALFDAFVPSAYRHHTAGRWKAQDAQRWLIFLASYLERKIGGPDLAWWQIPQATSGTTFGLTAGLVTGLVAWLLTGLVAWLLTGLVAGLAAGLVLGPVTGLVAGLAAGITAGIWTLFGGVSGPSRGMRVSLAELVGALAGALVVGLAVGFVLGPMSWIGAMFNIMPSLGLVSGSVGGFVGGLVFGFLLILFRIESAPSDLAVAVSPSALLTRDRKAALLFMLVTGLVAGLVTGLPLGLVFGPKAGLVAGLVAGLGVGLWLSVIRAAWPSYTLARGWLASRRQLPWSLMSFLEDAHQRGVLRQVGAVYQFRHIELQRQLATRPPESARGS